MFFEFKKFHVNLSQNVAKYIQFPWTIQNIILGILKTGSLILWAGYNFYVISVYALGTVRAIFSNFSQLWDILGIF